MASRLGTSERAAFVLALSGSAVATLGDVVVRLARLPQMVGAGVAVIALGAGGFAIGYTTAASVRTTAIAVGAGAVLYSISTIAWVMSAASNVNVSAAFVAALFSFGIAASCPALGFSSGRRARARVGARRRAK